MKNVHLVPINVVDLVEKINDKNLRENERNNYIFRLEATVAYINEALNKNSTTNSFKKKTFR